jgi:hypothetical protein
VHEYAQTEIAGGVEQPSHRTGLPGVAQSPGGEHEALEAQVPRAAQLGGGRGAVIERHDRQAAVGAGRGAGRGGVVEVARERLRLVDGQGLEIPQRRPRQHLLVDAERTQLSRSMMEVMRDTIERPRLQCGLEDPARQAVSQVSSTSNIGQPLGVLPAASMVAMSPAP